ncbi:MAG TPA: ABC transporter ATP-binding protein [Alphaproteobacteria bacterium]|nr:ABC transporter ATP-binding protein [Alphaproteobacteria bacterium]
MSKSNAFKPIDPASWALVRRLVGEHVRPYLWIIGFSLICMAVAAASTAAMAKYMEPFFNQMLTEQNTDQLYWAAGIVFGIFFAKGIATYGQHVSMNWVGQRVIADVQCRLYHHIINADLAYFHDSPTGELISRFTNDVARLRYAVSDALTGVGLHLFTLAFLIAVMFYQDWILASVTFFIFPVAILPIIRIGRRMRKISSESQIELGRFTSFLSETFQGARHVKAYGMERYEAARADAIIENVFRLYFKSFRTRSASHPIMETLGGAAIVAVILYGGHMVISGAKTPGEFVSFIAAVLLAYAPAKRLALLNASLQEGLAAAHRIFDVLEIKTTITEKPGAKVLDVPDGKIRFEKVAFAYTEGVPALRGVSLTVPAGETVALVGPSGAGKSTIMNLIPRFYDVDTGSVTIDGIDVRDATLDSLRANIGLVSQEISLFDDTVRANIAYGRPDATEAEIVAAARQAAAHDFIVALPHGYDTQVGGQGAKLSGGQRQRVSIARAMLKNAPILLLDEATSALDTASERQVQTALAKLMEGRTTLVIAHRLSTVLDADLIYVIDEGRVIESGNHAALIAQDGAYARLYAMQLADDRDDEPDPKPARQARV